MTLLAKLSAGSRCPTFNNFASFSATLRFLIDDHQNISSLSKSLRASMSVETVSLKPFADQKPGT